jgi:hypothetical protein
LVDLPDRPGTKPMRIAPITGNQISVLNIATTS